MIMVVMLLTKLLLMAMLVMMWVVVTLRVEVVVVEMMNAALIMEVAIFGCLNSNDGGVAMTEMLVMWMMGMLVGC